MPFDIVTRTVLEYYTTNHPATEYVWYGPWNNPFPSAQGYIVTPQRRLPDDPESHIPDFIIEVVKMSTAHSPFGLSLSSKSKIPSIGSMELQLFNASSIDKLTLLLPAPHTRRSTGSEQLDHIGGTARRRTTDQMFGPSLIGIIPLMTKPRLTTSKHWRSMCCRGAAPSEGNYMGAMRIGLLHEEG
ncbi:hypothetical protein BGW80DRAFT_309315 [Lactifluus volemus]|nr:hypothetical protein BGW80DRAFT_309315 [Lactifluus volemus]